MKIEKLNHKHRPPEAVLTFGDTLEASRFFKVIAKNRAASLLRMTYGNAGHIVVLTFSDFNAVEEFSHGCPPHRTSRTVVL